MGGGAGTERRGTHLFQDGDKAAVVVGNALLQHLEQRVVLRQLLQRGFVGLRVEQENARDLAALLPIHHLFLDAARKELALHRGEGGRGGDGLCVQRARALERTCLREKMKRIAGHRVQFLR